jgi:pyrimidine operon attenuation protein / uracil phosphoribosyltransferase
MKILEEGQIRQKIKRLAIEILEKNTEVDELVLGGINNKGYSFAELLKKEIESISPTRIHLMRIKLNPAAPLSHSIQMGLPGDQLSKKVILVIDDVTNTGRTLFYAMKPIMDILPKKVEVAVLVERMHKSFPIHVDYVGLRLFTTVQENIEVTMEGSSWGVELS